MTRSFFTSVFCLLTCIASCVFGDTTATFNLTGTNSGASIGGVYTSPYFAQITTGATTVSTAAICDDFTDDSYLGETWTADVTSLSSLNTQNSTVLWHGTSWNGTQLTQAQEYMAVAILTEDLLPIYSTQPAIAGDYGYAIWALTFPNESGQLPPQDYLDTGTWSTVEGYVNTAVADVMGSNSNYNQLSDYSNVTIYSYDSAASAANDQPTGCGDTCPPPPQEFIVVGMPEPSMPLSLLFYFSALAGLVFVFRGRIVKSDR